MHDPFAGLSSAAIPNSPVATPNSAARKAAGADYDLALFEAIPAPAPSTVPTPEQLFPAPVAAPAPAAGAAPAPASTDSKPAEAAAPATASAPAPASSGAAVVAASDAVQPAVVAAPTSNSGLHPAHLSRSSTSSSTPIPIDAASTPSATPSHAAAAATTTSSSSSSSSSVATPLTATAPAPSEPATPVLTDVSVLSHPACQRELASQRTAHALAMQQQKDKFEQTLAQLSASHATALAALKEQVKALEQERDNLTATHSRVVREAAEREQTLKDEVHALQTRCDEQKTTLETEISKKHAIELEVTAFSLPPSMHCRTDCCVVFACCL
jgi:hypothetical protein